MRWFYLIVTIPFVAATLLFAIQNLQVVTLSFLGFGASVPLALLVALAYLLGMVTGGSLFACSANPWPNRDCAPAIIDGDY